MSIADSSKPVRMRVCRGFTALEVMISMALVATMALVVQQTVGTADNAALYMKAVQTATERGHNLSYEIREQVTSSRRLFSGDAVGRGFRDALDLSSAPPVAWARLPVIEEGGRLGPDESGAPATGNFLLFVGETDSTSVVVDPSENRLRHVDTYRFHAIYPHETDRMVVVEVGGQKALDLVAWQSVEFPNYRQLASIDDEEDRAAVVSSLVNDFGYTLAWDPAGAVDSSFYALGANGDLADAPSPNVTIDEHPVDSRGGRLVYANTQLARTDPDDGRRRAVFSMDDPATWQPHGFEVKIVGRSGSRQVWMHLVTEVQARGGTTAAHPSTMIMATKDL